ncbi:Amino-acid acetyltransferase, mitochondrial, partial [Quaeritorhiza haematococci]
TAEETTHPDVVTSVEDASAINKHVGVIHVETGDLCDEALAAFSHTLVRLQKLGLQPVVVVGRLLDGGGTKGRERDERDEKGAVKEDPLSECYRIAEVIEQTGGRAMVITHPAFEYRFDNKETRETSVTADAETLGVQMDAIHTAFRLHQIPILHPATTVNNKKISLPTRRAIVALSKTLAADPKLGIPMKIVLINQRGGLTWDGRPVRFLNLEEEYPRFREYLEDRVESDVTPLESFEVEDGMVGDASRAHDSEGVEELDMLHEILNDLPLSTSAIVASADMSPGLIANLITDKPPAMPSVAISTSSSTSSSSPSPSSTPTPTSTSSSSPSSSTLQLDPQVTQPQPPTIIRRGLKVSIHPRSLFHTLHIPSLHALLESSFGRELDMEGYMKRIEGVGHSVIVVGDYHGAAIVTLEPVVGGEKEQEQEAIPYLDKLAVAPTSQGIGAADILWKYLLQGYPDLSWRSRATNPVNK